MKKRFTMMLAIVAAALSAPALAGPDGKTLFDYYRCNSCHGDKGQGSATAPATRPIAGMDREALVETINQLIASGKHEDYADPGCGETPSTSQIQAIADYVARLSVK